MQGEKNQFDAGPTYTDIKLDRKKSMSVCGLAYLNTARAVSITDGQDEKKKKIQDLEKQRLNYVLYHITRLK